MVPAERPKRVLVIDDSAFMRHTVRKILAADAHLEVIDDARNGREGLERALALQPDVITLDIQMPEMDGLTMLKELMQRRPTPVVMLSSLVQEGAAATLEALEMGAVDFVAKPASGRPDEMATIREALLHAVQAAALSRLRRRLSPAPAVRSRPPAATPPSTTAEAKVERLVVIGSSTGGPVALTEVVPRLPADLGAAVVIVQHMPPLFTASLAERLDGQSALRVTEAQEGERLRPNHVYLAQGGAHLAITPAQTLRISLAPPMHGVRPAIDHTLEAVSKHLGARTVVVVLTGMGRDGADGAALIKQAGGKVLAQDEATCVVYGMPRAVVEMGVVDKVVPLSHMADAIRSML